MPALQEALAGRPHQFVTDFSPYPSLSEVLATAKACGELQADGLLAIGGGSAIDLSKLAAVTAPLGASAAVYLRKSSAPPGTALPVIAAPTTAGTGAEVTHFAALYLDTGKVSVADPRMRPRVGIVDPVLTASMPADLTAATGLDALCQAVESTWSVGSTDVSMRYAERALRLCLQWLPKAVHHSTAKSRRAMAVAAHLAGRAINISKTTACHAMSYELTGRFGLLHGHAVAVTLAAMLRYNAGVTSDDTVDPRGAVHTMRAIRIIVRAFGAGTVNAAADAITSLVRGLNLPTRLSDVGVKPQDIHGLVSAVNTERLSNNPRLMSPEVVRGIFESIL